MKKSLLLKIEKFLKNKVKVGDTSQKSKEEFNLAVNELHSILTELSETKFIRDCDGWKGFDTLIINKRQNEPFHFEPINNELSLAQKLQLATINAKIAIDQVESISRKISQEQNKQVITLSDKDFAAVEKEIANPRKPNKKLKKAFKEHKDKLK